MKRFTFLFVSLIVLVLALAFTPVVIRAAPLMEEPLPTNMLNVVVAIVLGFASLMGVSRLIAVLVNLFKAIHVVKDGTADKWAAAMNLLAFIALVALGVFRPGLTMEILDGYAGQIAMVLMLVLGFVAQMTGSKSAHDQLKAAGIPLIGMSYNTNA